MEFGGTLGVAVKKPPRVFIEKLFTLGLCFGCQEWVEAV
jgi:hypothetical protein